MELETFVYRQGSGWSVESFPQLDSPQTLVLAFGSSHYRNSPEILGQLKSAYPSSIIVGCSTAGEIVQRSVEDGSLSVAVVKFANTRLFRADVDAVNSQEAGLQLANELKAVDLRSVFILSDGLNVNGSDIVKGFNQTFGSSVVVTGGLAADGDRFEQTWIIEDGCPVSGRVCAVGFYGDSIQVGYGSKGGWDIFGPERTVTRSEGNVLYELDGQSALQLYRRYLGEHADGLPATALLFPLAVRRSPSEPPVVRTILSIDESNGTMSFAGDLPEGSRAQLMRASFDRLIDGAESAAAMTDREDIRDRPILCLAISCVGRRLVLGERVEEEVEAVLDILPDQALQVGFYSYGEISPLISGSCDLHNQTMTLTTIHER